MLPSAATKWPGRGFVPKVHFPSSRRHEDAGEIRAGGSGRCAAAAVPPRAAAATTARRRGPWDEHAATAAGMGSGGSGGSERCGAEARRGDAEQPAVDRGDGARGRAGPGGEGARGRGAEEVQC